MSTDPAAAHGRLLNRNFVLLFQGQLVSQLGTQAFSLAMMYWLMETTGSASLMGLLMMAATLPGVVLGPIGGAVVDRHSRLAIILLSDVLRGLAVLALAALMVRYPEAHELIVGALFAVALFGGVVNAVFLPAMTAAIPDLVPPGKVAAANSLNQLAVQASMVIGQAVGGLLYRLLGATVLFAANGLTFLFSAASEAWIHLPPQPSRGPSSIGRWASYRRDIGEGVRHVWERGGMRLFLLTTSCVNFLAMPVIVLLPFYVTVQLAQGAEWYGFLLAALGLGTASGYILAGVLKASPRSRSTLIQAAMICVGVLLALTGWVRNPFLALAVFLGVGLSTGIINIFVVTLFQISTPEAMRGRIMSLVMTTSGAVAPLGMALGGLLGDLTDKNVAAVYSTCGVLIALVAIAASTRPRLRCFLTWDDE